MRKFKRFAATLLAITTASVLAIGCSNSDKKNDSNNDDKKVVLSIGDTDITYDIAKFYAYNEQAYTEANYLVNGYSIDWSSQYKDADGKDTDMTVEDFVKDKVLQRIKLFYSIANYAKEEGATLTDEDNKKVESFVNNYINGNDKVVNATSGDKEFLTKIYENEAYYNKGCEMILKDKEFKVDKEKMHQVKMYAVEITKDLSDFPEDTANTIKQRVDAGEDITKVADFYGLVANIGNVGKGDFNGDSFETTSLKMKTGQCEVVVQEDEVIVLYCVTDNDEEATKNAIEAEEKNLKSDEVQKFYDEYIKKFEVSLDEDLWKAINYNTNIYTSSDLEDLLKNQLETTSSLEEKK